MRDVVVRKTANGRRGLVPFEFILGDLFHSDPVQIAQPVRPEYLASNLPAGSNPDCSGQRPGLPLLLREAPLPSTGRLRRLQ